jgi:hypothetical protein
MHFSTIVATLASVSLASARITGFNSPREIKPGDKFDITLITDNATEPVEELSVSWGYAEAGVEDKNYKLGKWISTELLGPAKSNTKDNLTIEAVAPMELANNRRENILTVTVHEAEGKTGKSVVKGFRVGFITADRTTESQLISGGGSDWKQDATCRYRS